MPERSHRQLARSAARKGLRRGSRAYGAYVYGTLRRIEKGQRTSKPSRAKRTRR